MKKNRKLFLAAVAMIFVCSTLFFLKADPISALRSLWIDERQLGEMCIDQAYPTAKSADTENTETAESGAETGRKASEVDDSEGNSSDEDESKGDKKDSDDEEIEVTGDPLVIIYHTHSTESYMPYSDSNYHSEDEEGTVRDVGDILESELKKNGINVVHDKTMHDRPSYNESYSRSLETIQSLIKKYPTAVYVIDLHRDAAVSSATEGKYIEIDGEKVATFSMVVGKGNDNYTELYAYAKKVSEAAENLYDGFGGAIIEREYRYNEYVSDRALLLEVGNNKNTIEEARLCAEYFAEVLTEVIKDEQ